MSRIFQEAHVTVEGDTSVGIPDITFEVSDFHLDLGTFDEEDRQNVVRDTLSALLNLGKVLYGEEPRSASLDHQDGSWLLTSHGRLFWFSNVNSDEDNA